MGTMPRMEFVRKRFCTFFRSSVERERSVALLVSSHFFRIMPFITPSVRGGVVSWLSMRAKRFPLVKHVALPWVLSMMASFAPLVSAWIMLRMLSP